VNRIPLAHMWHWRWWNQYVVCFMHYLQFICSNWRIARWTENCIPNNAILMSINIHAVVLTKLFTKLHCSWSKRSCEVHRILNK
jgi:hypothetical protein